MLATVKLSFTTVPSYISIPSKNATPFVTGTVISSKIEKTYPRLLELLVLQTTPLFNVGIL